MIDTIITVFEIIGVISFSISGAFVAIDKEMDFVGVIFLSIITTFFGGIMRDLILGRTPVFFTETMMFVYIAVSVLTSIAVFFFAAIFKRQYVRNEARISRINNYIDAVGIGAFSVNSVKISIEYLESVGREASPFLVITLAMISAIGGGVVRDVCMREIPFVFRKRIYALATLGGAIIYYILSVYVFRGSAVGHMVSSIIGASLVISVRVLATVFKWNLPRAIDFSALNREAEEGALEESAEENRVAK